MRAFVWALFTYHWCHKRRRLGHSHTQREDDVKIWRTQWSTHQGERPQGKPTPLTP